jgi:aryl-alcohol dehydrogenase-like predicted oxidoreductase
MQYRKLGRSGLQVSAIAYGTMFEHKNADATLLRQAFDAGVNFVDTADAYGEKGEVETLLGTRLKELPRDEVVLATKCRWGYGAQGPNRRGLSRKHMVHACEASLKRLGVEFIDLYQLHGYDETTPFEEIVTTVVQLQRQGKILYWGLSNYNAALTIKLLKVCDELGAEYPVSHQPEYNVLAPGLVEDQGKYVGLASVGKEFGFGLIVYSPLGGGMLTGKYSQGIPKGSRLDVHGGAHPSWKEKMLRPEKQVAVQKLTALAQQVELPLAQLALAWAIQRPNVNAAIIGASNAEQLKINLAAADVTLGEKALEAIEQIRDEYKAAINYRW